MSAAVENGMVVGLGAALDRHYAEADPAAYDFAALRVLGDVREFVELLDLRDGLADAADRALRIESRLQEADNDVVLAALLLAAHRNDAADTLRAARLLTLRFLADQSKRIERIAEGAE